MDIDYACKHIVEKTAANPPQYFNYDVSWAYTSTYWSSQNLTFADHLKPSRRILCVIGKTFCSKSHFLRNARIAYHYRYKVITLLFVIAIALRTAGQA